jgi:Holliday junction resolvasome RuvABC endonuclease subunit
MRKRSRVSVFRLPRLFPDVPGRLPPRRPSWTRVLAIDPGLGGTGWALWTSEPQAHPVWTPVNIGVIYGKAKDDTLAARCEEIAVQLNRHQLETSWMFPTAVLVELPQHMASAAGIAAQSGGIYKLTFLAGYLARALYPADVFVVNPGEWKGQLPKSVTQHRIERVLGKPLCKRLNIKTHAWDAVGIGLWAMGRL